MGRFAHCISYSIFWISILFTSAVRKDLCEPCVKIEACPSFALLNKHEQQVWLKRPCDGQQANGEKIVFEITSITKGDYICCPHLNSWKNDNEEYSPSHINKPLKSDEIRHNNNSEWKKFNQSENQNQLLYATLDIHETQALQSNNDQNPKKNGQIYRNSQNKAKGPYKNGMNSPGTPYIQENKPLEQNHNENKHHGNQDSYDLNPNFIQHPTTSGNIWRDPVQQEVISLNPEQVQNPGQSFNVYPRQNLYNNNGNLNIFNIPNLGDQCANQISLLPDPQTKCCGQDVSGIESITDLQNQLNLYAPSNSRSSQNIPQQQQLYQNQPINLQKQKLSDENSTVEITLEDRIAGGKETELDQFPWTIFLKATFDYGNKQAVFTCGGSLISRQYVITAGHCLLEQGAKLIDLNIVLAEYDKKTFPRDCKFQIEGNPKCIDNVVMRAETIILHPQYNDDNLHNDIALIRLQGYAPYTRFIRPICLPPINIDRDDLSNLPLAVTGWGQNGPYVSDIKQSTVVRLIPRVKCSKSYPNLSPSHLCAAGRTGEDTCKGDSGGPLMMLFRGIYYVIGIVSGKRAGSPCGTRLPSLYANVYQYVPWIQSIITN